MSASVCWKYFLTFSFLLLAYAHAFNHIGNIQQFRTDLQSRTLGRSKIHRWANTVVLFGQVNHASSSQECVHFPDCQYRPVSHSFENLRQALGLRGADEEQMNALQIIIPVDSSEQQLASVDGFVLHHSFEIISKIVLP